MIKHDDIWYRSHKDPNKSAIWATQMATGVISRLETDALRERDRVYSLTHWFIWENGVRKEGPFESLDVAKVAYLLLIGD